MKLKKIIQYSFLCLSLTAVLFSLTGCSQEEESLNKKAISEVEYLESKFVSILNRLNNITFENYKVTTEKATLTKDSAQQEKSSNSSSQNSGGQEEEMGGSKGDSQGASNSESESSNSATIIASQMSPNTILNPATTEIDWTGLKNEVENLYYAWNTILLDLHQLNIDRNAILSFSSDLDKATKYIKNEDKVNSLLAVANLYGYLPKYLESVSDDTSKKNITKTKSLILNAYSLVETGDWGAIKGEIAKADETFRLVTTDANFVSSNSYRVNKTYVLLNELKNSLNLQDNQIFYIKYRNLMEEIITL